MNFGSLRSPAATNYTGLSENVNPRRPTLFIHIWILSNIGLHLLQGKSTRFMMKFVVLLLASSINILAEPVKIERLIVGSKEYLNATIEKESELSAKIVHDSGVAHAKLTDLPEDLRSKLGYDEAAAKLLVEKQNQAAKRQQEAAAILAKSELFEMQVSQVLPDGLLTYKGLIVGFPAASKMVDGSWIRCYAIPVGRYQYESMKGLRTVPKFQFVAIPPVEHHTRPDPPQQRGRDNGL